MSFQEFNKTLKEHKYTIYKGGTSKGIGWYSFTSCKERCSDSFTTLTNDYGIMTMSFCKTYSNILFEDGSLAVLLPSVYFGGNFE